MRAGRVAQAVGKTALGVVALALFVLAILILKKGVGALGPLVVERLSVDSPLSAMGFGWLFAYVILSGSPVAAVSLTFYASGVLDAIQTFMMIAGSRFGASFVVLALAFLYVVRRKGHGQSVEMGVLSLLTTYVIYGIAVPLGAIALASGALADFRPSLPGGLFDLIDVVFGPTVAALQKALPAWALFLAGIVAIVVSFNLFDRALPDMTAASPVRNLESHVFRPSVMFAIGSIVTLFTLSVSVSLGILVPLSAKGIARRENVIPYIMGANITTFVDTLFVSLLVGEPTAFSIVLVEMLAVALVSLVVLLFFFDRFERGLLAVSRLILAKRAGFLAFLVTIFAVPVLLLLL